MTKYTYDPRFDRLNYGLLHWHAYEDRMNWAVGNIANYEYTCSPVENKVRWTETAKHLFAKGIEYAKMPLKL